MKHLSTILQRLNALTRCGSVLLCLGCILAATLGAQTTTSQSRFYYAIENLDSGAVVRRGVTTKQGIPQNELILAPDKNYREWLFQADTGLIGVKNFRTPSSGQQFVIPKISLGLPITPDTDHD